MSMCYECDDCGLVLEVDGIFAPAEPDEYPGGCECGTPDCGGWMDYIGEFHFDESGTLVEDLE